MGLFSNFLANLSSNESSQFTSRLHQKIAELLPDKNEEDLIKTACLSGLMARIAYNDMEIHEGEMELITQSLEKWMNLNSEESIATAKLCVEEIKELAGIENHLYCLPLRESLSGKERYKIIECLFAIAASDGSVSNQEAEEIRNINQGLLLEHQHFISAKSTVLEYLGSLKS